MSAAIDTEQRSKRIREDYRACLEAIAPSVGAGGKWSVWSIASVPAHCKGRRCDAPVYGGVTTQATQGRSTYG